MGFRIPDYLLTGNPRLFRSHHNIRWWTVAVFLVPSILFLWVAEPVVVLGFRTQVLLPWFFLGLVLLWFIPMLTRINQLDQDRKNGTLPLFVLSGMRPIEILFSRFPFGFSRLLAYLGAWIPVLFILFLVYDHDLPRLLAFLGLVLGTCLLVYAVTCLFALDHAQDFLRVRWPLTCIGILIVLSLDLGWLLNERGGTGRGMLLEAPGLGLFGGLVAGGTFGAKATVSTLVFIWGSGLLTLFYAARLLKRNWRVSPHEKAQTKPKKKKADAAGKIESGTPSLAQRRHRKGAGLVGDRHPITWLGDFHLGLQRWLLLLGLIPLYAIGLYLGWEFSGRSMDAEDMRYALIVSSLLIQILLVAAVILLLGAPLLELKRTGHLESVVKGALSGPGEVEVWIRTLINRPMEWAFVVNTLVFLVSVMDLIIINYRLLRVIDFLAYGLAVSCWVGGIVYCHRHIHSLSFTVIVGSVEKDLPYVVKAWRAFLTLMKAILPFFLIAAVLEAFRLLIWGVIPMVFFFSWFQFLILRTGLKELRDWYERSNQIIDRTEARSEVRWWRRLKLGFAGFLILFSLGVGIHFAVMNQAFEDQTARAMEEGRMSGAPREQGKMEPRRNLSMAAMGWGRSMARPVSQRYEDDYAIVSYSSNRDLIERVLDELPGLDFSASKQVPGTDWYDAWISNGVRFGLGWTMELLRLEEDIEDDSLLVAPRARHMEAQLRFRSVLMSDQQFMFVRMATRGLDKRLSRIRELRREGKLDREETKGIIEELLRLRKSMEDNDLREHLARACSDSLVYDLRHVELMTLWSRQNGGTSRDLCTTRLIAGLQEVSGLHKRVLLDHMHRQEDLWKVGGKGPREQLQYFNYNPEYKRWYHKLGPAYLFMEDYVRLVSLWMRDRAKAMVDIDNLVESLQQTD